MKWLSCEVPSFEYDVFFTIIAISHSHTLIIVIIALTLTIVIIIRTDEIVTEGSRKVPCFEGPSEEAPTGFQLIVTMTKTRGYQVKG